MRTNIILILLPVVIFFSCDKTACEKAPNVSNVNISIIVKRLEKEMFALKTKHDIKDFLSKHQLFAKKFLKINEYPHDSMVINQLFQLINDDHIDTLYQDVQRVFEDFSSIEEQFTDAFKNIKYYYPDFYVPEINTVVSGLGTDFYISDSLIVIGLDMFLGPEGRYKDPNMPLYILNRYQKQYLVPSCIFVISDKYNRTDIRDHTLLKEMVAYGKAYYFTQAMLPCLSDTLIIGYTKEELKGVNKNEDIVWAHFLKNNLLYETNHMTKNKYIGERPKTYDIGEKAPGRIGAWLGWEIVKKYMDENDQITLQQLMANKNAQEIFTKSKYKPVPEELDF